jgi:hypothetical protein
MNTVKQKRSVTVNALSKWERLVTKIERFK